MKISVLFLTLICASAWAANDYLRPEDQPYYQNDANGRNNLDRIDNDVREINKLWGEIIALKAEIKQLKEQVTTLSAAAAAAAAKNPESKTTTP